METSYGPQWAFKPIDMNRGEYEYLDVVFISSTLADRIQLGVERIPTGTILELPPGTHFLEITLYGDNVDPLSRLFRLVWDGQDYTSARMYEAKNRGE
jgi:hypothetical protein